MKRPLSLILAALILASAMTACGNTEPSASVETNAAETNAPETSIFETDIAEPDPAETEADAPAYTIDKITENGMAKSHIVLFDGADKVEKYAAEELVHHIKLVSGAEVSVTNAVQSDSLPIIIATPDSYPELETLFPDDLSWLREIGEENSTERYGDDGFAIRVLDNKLYIFGATPRGALNGVYDFIEDNMGVLWTRAEDALSEGTVYKDMPTIELIKADYREKSPFLLRTWTLGWSSWETQVMFSRNKLNYYSIPPFNFTYDYTFDDLGITPIVADHNIKWWVQNSPIYDPNDPEYWNTDASGNYLTPANSGQVNFWSDKTVDVLAASVIAFLDKYKESENITYVGICCEDMSNGSQHPYDSQPFEYAPGQFVEPNATNYLTTVFYTMLNKVARKVAEVYPDVRLSTYIYTITEDCPECEIEDNIYPIMTLFREDLTSSLFDSENENSVATLNTIEAWKKKTNNFFCYNYYGCFLDAAVYERPIWEIMKEHMTYYADSCFNGVCSLGVSDSYDMIGRYLTTVEGIYGTTYHAQAWEMNTLTYWLYAKLAWNPYADLDALIAEFCDKCYGDASPYMQEYYRLLKAGWDEGIPYFREYEYRNHMTYNTDPGVVDSYFIFNPEFTENAGLADKMLEALNNAWNAANNTEKARICYIKEIMEAKYELN